MARALAKSVRTNGLAPAEVWPAQWEIKPSVAGARGVERHGAVASAGHCIGDVLARNAQIIEPIAIEIKHGSQCRATGLRSLDLNDPARERGQGTSGWGGRE